MKFSPEILLSQLSGSPRAGRYQVAFSGGLDSTVLLHALASLGDRLSAPLGIAHVHHGLHPETDAWAEHCRGLALRLSLPFQLIRVNAGPRRGESPEAAARSARYRAFESILQRNECLLTAHQRDDQAETLLLQLLRGAGPAGLASMPVCTRFGRGWLLRPLLDFSRAELKCYAERQGYVWLEDTSNRDTALDRNYLRHEVLPRLVRRWPAAGFTLAGAAKLQAEAAELLRALAHRDLETLAGSRADTLSVSALRRLADARQRNVLRVWIEAQGLPLPPRRKLIQVTSEALHARPDAMPCVRWTGAEIRRYRDDLYGMPPLVPHDPTQSLSWNLDEDLTITPLGKDLKAKEYQELCGTAGSVAVRFRRGGERCKPRGRDHHHDLKHLFQEAGVPPWQRDRIPLIYVDEKLIAVAGYWICC